MPSERIIIISSKCLLIFYLKVSKKGFIQPGVWRNIFFNVLNIKIEEFCVNYVVHQPLHGKLDSGRKS